MLRRLSAAFGIVPQRDYPHTLSRPARMRLRRRRHRLALTGVLTIVAALAFGLPVALASSPASAPAHLEVHRPTVTTVPLQPAVDEYQAFADEAALQRLQYAQAAAYEAAVAAANAPKPSTSSSGGGCAGWYGPQSNGVSDAPAGFPTTIIATESGGDPTALNCSGAEGPAQILGSHFAPGGQCYGMTYAQCWNALWAGGAGCSNWRGDVGGCAYWIVPPSEPVQLAA